MEQDEPARKKPSATPGEAGSGLFPDTCRRQGKGRVRSHEQVLAAVAAALVGRHQPTYDDGYPERFTLSPERTQYLAGRVTESLTATFSITPKANDVAKEAP